MSHSGETLHYQLPKYVGTDIINPLTDFNDANDAIDEALYNANTSAASAVETAEGAASTVGSYDERITQAQQAADNAITQSDNTMDMLADEFDPLKQGGYAIGDIVIYQQKLYTFINPHTGAWDAGDVVQQPIGDAVKATIEQGKSDIAEETQEALQEIAGQTVKVTATQAMIAPPFDATKVDGYAIDDCVTYADKLYKFTAAHVGAWTGLDVTEINVEGQIAEMKQTFQDGVDAIYNAEVAQDVSGVPTASTPTALANGVGAIATAKISEGRKDVGANVEISSITGTTTSGQTFNVTAGHYYAIMIGYTAQNSTGQTYVDITISGANVLGSIRADLASSGAQFMYTSAKLFIIKATSNTITISNYSGSVPTIELAKLGLYE